MLLTASPLALFWRSLAADRFLQILLAVLLGLVMWLPGSVVRFPDLVDWPTITALSGLLLLTKAVELSGWLHRLGEQLMETMRTERALALLLVAVTALLSTVLTNDVALFVVVPLTISLRRNRALPVSRLVIFEALAANAGSVLTPFGNPQNLFLWQLSQWSFWRFTAAMLPLAALLMVLLVLLSLFAFPARPIAVSPLQAPVPLNRRLLLLSLALYPPFLILTDLGHGLVGFALVLTACLCLHRAVLARADWSLILVFVVMFIDVRLIGQVHQLGTALALVGPAPPPQLFLTGIVTAQLISNVPAAILLTQYTRDWLTIAYAVNVGGFGLVAGSMANIIALRLLADRKAWLSFHVWSLPFLLLSSVLAGSWLFLR